MPPPHKKQRRTIVLSSDEDEDATSDVLHGSPKNNLSSRRNVSDVGVADDPTKRSTRNGSAVSTVGTQSKNGPVISKTKGSKGVRSTNTTPASSPKKPKSKPPAPKKGSLYSFFNSTVLSQSSASNGSVANRASQTDQEELDDAIEDDSDGKSADGKRNSVRRGSSGVNGTSSIAFRSTVQPSLSQAALPASSSQRFRTLSAGASSASRSPERKPIPKDTRPWAERYAPVNVDELAVHKKKVADVKGWLQDAFDGRHRQRLLLLKGPSGTGKTATATALAQAMDFDVSEWRNPAEADYSAVGFESVSNQFENFLGRSSKFGSLNLAGARSLEQSERSDKQTSNKKKIILIEEFPNTFTRTSTALQAFRSSILQFLYASNPPASSSNTTTPTNPLIMIMSETATSSATSISDSFTAHRILGPEILDHPRLTVFDFNPIAPSFLSKAIDLVITKEACDSGRRRLPGPVLLRKLCEVGDVRSAIGSLEFLCLRSDDKSDWSGRVASKNRTGTSKGSSPTTNTTKMTKMEMESIEMVTQREATLGIFHAVGKVVYNKRETNPLPITTVPPSDRPPDRNSTLKHHERPALLNLNVNTLMDEAGTDPQTFIAALHENYPLSCSGAESTVNALNGCLDALSDADFLLPGHSQSHGSMRNSFGNGLPHGQSATDNLRQEEICFHVAVRGTLFALPMSVKRESGAKRSGAGGSGGGGGISRSSGVGSMKGGDAFKMFYPASLRLWRKAEEIETLVDRWMDLLRAQAQAGSSGPKGGGLRRIPPKTQNFSLGIGEDDEEYSAGVETWATRSGAFFGDNAATVKMGTLHNLEKCDPSREDASPAATYVTLSGQSARAETIMERLPYLRLIRHFEDTELGEELSLITQFGGRAAELSGLGGDGGVEDEDEDEMDGEEELEEKGKVLGAVGAGKTFKGRSGRGTGDAKSQMDVVRARDSEGISEAVGGLGLEGLIDEDDDIVDDW
ncbi:Cell cycle checkpoint protein rad17 [Agyrium rufum]|nr:Cell cycle checkpoint protein rad17 [Agyrium rufum]